MTVPLGYKMFIWLMCNISNGTVASHIMYHNFHDTSCYTMRTNPHLAMDRIDRLCLHKHNDNIHMQWRSERGFGGFNPPIVKKMCIFTA